MNKDKLNQFLEGELDFDELQKTRYNSDFVDSYKNVIAESNTNVPDFNPFEKIESHKKKRLSSVRRFLPYAATILLVLSFIVLYQINQSRQAKNTLTKQEMYKLQENTEFALLHFSKELNTCMANFEAAKKMQQPISDMKSLKSIKTNSNNPLKQFKIK